MYDMHLSLCIDIIGNYVHSIYSSFTKNIKLFIHIMFFFVCLFVYVLKYSLTQTCSESRVEALQIFFFFPSDGVFDSLRFAKVWFDWELGM